MAAGGRGMDPEQNSAPGSYTGHTARPRPFSGLYHGTALPPHCVCSSRPQRHQPGLAPPPSLCRSPLCHSSAQSSLCCTALTQSRRQASGPPVSTLMGPSEAPVQPPAECLFNSTWLPFYGANSLPAPGFSPALTGAVTRSDADLASKVPPPPVQLQGAGRYRHCLRQMRGPEHY
ncbi:hypothetical protein NDU88_006736 [Pleurodeles waltl]|uniref:Uncharacterized protein n=1 Tax=Pleurodeles waltl TaxID=8319 RepID=A0AAV7SQR2_PLEWA|nr:hypothetical protein NDU88_006736 [Pleurodeles waltl]